MKVKNASYGRMLSSVVRFHNNIFFLCKYYIQFDIDSNRLLKHIEVFIFRML